MKDEHYLHVAVGVIKNDQGHVLISLRHNSAHQGGLWEFPGGKVESGESTEQALKRELKEELGISAHILSPLIKTRHQYSDLNVLLDVWTVSRFSGSPTGLEGQRINWVCTEQLTDYNFPAANLPIITAARLPTEYAILNAAGQPDLLEALQFILNKDIKLIQARLKSLPTQQITHFIERAIPLCKEKGAQLLVNSSIENNHAIKADGIHLTSTDLLALDKRPTGFSWVAASCHHLKELKHAEKIGVDFVVLAPVLPTLTHPEAKPLGWDMFNHLTSKTNIPVFALGGMEQSDKLMAQSLGGQGIAGIRCFLN